MKKITSLFMVIATISLLASCNNSEEEPKTTTKKENKTYSPDERGEEIESYMAQLDSSQNYAMGSSLDYTRSDGSLVWVDFWVDDSSNIVKIKQSYTLSKEGSILSNIFYYRKGVICSTKEYFETGSGDAMKFVERVTYYDDKGKALVSKHRAAPYEELLIEEVFNVTDTKSCSDAVAFRALNQEAEFETNFKGVVAQPTANYIIVGSNQPDGYTSSLLVQFYTPTVRKLLDNEDAMMDTKLEVEFEKVNDPTGFTFQSLLDVRIAKQQKEKEIETKKEEKSL